MVCSSCGRTLTGFEHELCMDCSNREVVESKDYTRDTLMGLQDMGYSKEEILDALNNDQYLKQDEALEILGKDYMTEEVVPTEQVYVVRAPEPIKVITLCGSTKFQKEFEDVNERLTLAGNLVISVGVFGHSKGIALSTQQKTNLDRIHLKKIDLADEIFVINVNGYIGSSTTSEIEYAQSMGKPINYLEKPTEGENTMPLVAVVNGSLEKPISYSGTQQRGAMPTSEISDLLKSSLKFPGKQQLGATTMSIEINTESRKVEVTSKDQAKTMIQATAYMHQITHAELKEFNEVQKLAEYYNIDTDDLKIIENTNVGEQEQGMFNIYRFPKEQDSSIRDKEIIDRMKRIEENPDTTVDWKDLKRE
jgi:hypothetical protein